MKKNSEIKEQVFEVSTELLASVESLDATTRVVLHSNQDIAEKAFLGNPVSSQRNIHIIPEPAAQ